MLGSNVSTVGGFPTAFIMGDQWGCECIQIYLTLSRRWEVSKLSMDMIKEFKRHWRESRVKQVISHIPFLVNLASTDNGLWKKSIQRVITELLYANQLGVSLVVIHLGSRGNNSYERGILRVIDALNIIFENAQYFDGYLLIETMAGQGTMMGSTFQEIRDVINSVECVDKIGICLDTAHIFQAGYDIRGYAGYRKIIQKIENIIGIEYIKVIHLNDSKSRLGSHCDRHIYIGGGQIGLQMFHAIMRDHRFLDIPKIIEVPQRDIQSKNSLTLLRELQETNTTLEADNNRSGQLTIEEAILCNKIKI